MTPAEAIEKEIEREEKELKEFEDEAKEFAKKNFGKTDRETLEQMIDLARPVLSRRDELDGKRLALAAVKADPSNPMSAINKEIRQEDQNANEIGRKAQALREKAFQEDQSGDHASAVKDREEAKKLSKEHDHELGRLRGKREAERAVRKAAAANK